MHRAIAHIDAKGGPADNDSSERWETGEAQMKSAVIDR
jgi:hypothetical protein